MTDRMPDFAMPSEEDLAAERGAEAIARARAADPASALARAEAAHERREERSAATLPPPDPATRIPERRADRPVREPSAVRRRALAIVRNPVVAFASGAVLVAAGFLTAPAITAWTERGTLAELQRIVDAYEDAIN
ncbi:hypothetical protein, partial [Burkholderia cenocepacia]|uniref:hypothetical protein n=1 Tax=Burkholderia cenocepacia TaxID=95486 RepID=UPI0038CC0446